MSLNDKFQQLVRKFYDDDSFIEGFESWAMNNCDIFNEEDEHKLEYTQLYQEFQGLFEKKFEELLQGVGMTQEEFVGICGEGREQDGEIGEEVEQFIQILLAVTDFDMFVQTMREMKQKQEERIS
eukprot:TRINITY_DN1392_c2_g1_i1.p3 TRINITY_DN1392_c2_g1~~TRINITY_DN1392_c2_g1_i1.p3  ORF type:complete len:125 (+),score=24.89 TRINITY_DN1392_c2_g1_i1:158-532(+)